MFSVRQIIVDIPTVEERGGRDWYETIPLSIIITQSMIITVCMQDTPVLHPFMEGTIRGFNTYMKTRFILQIKDAVETVYQRLEGWEGNGGFAQLAAEEE